MFIGVPGSSRGGVPEGRPPGRTRRRPPRWPAGPALTTAALLLTACSTTAAPAVTSTGTSTSTSTSTTVQAPTPVPAGSVQPDLTGLLSGFRAFWSPDPTTPLHGTVVGPETLAHNDEVAVWINNHATPAQRFTALQTSEYGSTTATYDPSLTLAPGLGSVLAPLYLAARRDGSLPLTGALLDSQTGSSGAFVDEVGTAKDAFSYPRPYLPGTATDPTAPCGAGENAAALAANRAGRPYATADGSLQIVPVPDAVDTTHEFAAVDVALGAGYPGLCGSGSFPSGHTVSNYEAGIMLATLLPELGPEILARAADNGNDRIVLGLHYPLDVIAGRMAGEAGLAARWSDPAYRRDVVEPARTELRNELEKGCGDTLAACAARSTPYRNDPYGGRVLPGGTAQVISDRHSTVSVYRERLDYGFAPVGPTGTAGAVPPGAENLLLTTFPTLTDAQRIEVLAQTEAPSGYPLDLPGPQGSYQRLDLGSAMSATVRVDADGTVSIISTGGTAAVVGP